MAEHTDPVTGTVERWRFFGTAARQAGLPPVLYGVLRDAADPYGTGLSRRGRRHLTQLGWTLGVGVRLDVHS